jgi:hypothetical protein
MGYHTLEKESEQDKREETKYWRCFRASKRLRKIKIRRNKKSLISLVILAQNAIILK